MKNNIYYNSLVPTYRKEIMLQQRGTSLIQEGVFIEASRVFLQDAIKNLMASGAVFITGGLPADTVVEIMYAIEKTKQAISMYNNIIDAKDASKMHMVQFMHSMDNAILENNIDQLVDIGMNTAIKLSQETDKVFGKGTSADVAHDIKVVADDLREDFLEFFKIKLAALADWVSSIIPDDGGNVSSFIKITLFTVIEDASSHPLKTFLSLVNNLPGESAQIIFDEAKLESFLIDICNQVADGIENLKGGAIDKGIDSVIDFQEKLYDVLPGVADINRSAGLGSQKIVDMFAGEDSKTGKVSRAFFDPTYRMDSADLLFDKTVEDLPIYIRSEIIPEIGNAVDVYAKFMKYIIAFLGLLEAATTGELESTFRANQEGNALYNQLVAEVRRSLKEQMSRRRYLNDKR